MSQTIATPPTVRLDSDVVGKPISRPDGPAKVSGSAKYAAEFNVPNLWYGYVVSSPITKGKIVVRPQLQGRRGPRWLALPAAARARNHV
jgi:CO/xanthine dehydrogenase Mo-binding subunit